MLRAGEVPGDDWAVEKFVETLLAIETLPPSELERRVTVERMFIGDGETERDAVCHWCADLIEDPTLAPEVLAVLGPVAVADLEWRTDCTLRPNPIMVGVRRDLPLPGTWWRCGQCGTAKTNDDTAVLVVGREDFSEPDMPITYCAECIQLVAAVLREEVAK